MIRWVFLLENFKRSRLWSFPGLIFKSPRSPNFNVTISLPLGHHTTKPIAKETIAVLINLPRVVQLEDGILHESPSDRFYKFRVIIRSPPKDLREDDLTGETVTLKPSARSSPSRSMLLRGEFINNFQTEFHGLLLWPYLGAKWIKEFFLLITEYNSMKMVSLLRPRFFKF